MTRIYEDARIRQERQQSWICPRCKTPGTTFEAGCENCGFNHGPKGYKADPDAMPSADEEIEMPVKRQGRRIEADPSEPEVVGPEVVRDPPEADVITVYRLIAYTGPAEWIDQTLDRSIDGTIEVGPGRRITATQISVLPGTALYGAIEAAASHPDPDWPERASKRLHPQATRPPSATVQLWTQTPTGDFELTDRRVVNTLTQALMHFADSLSPAGDALSLSGPECLTLAEGLRKGHDL